ncbi:VOC family protein [Streptomyces albidoflavus]|uniref:VOC family protein n=1 Tax=Streptomyces albidoflavus TaxID=1886 RepID=UPI0034531E38
MSAGDGARDSAPAGSRGIPGGVGGTLHHVEVWVRDLEAAVASWGWLLERLGWVPYQRWECGRSWRLGGTYLVVEASPAVRGGAYDRRRQGVNHLAFHVAGGQEWKKVTAEALERGWRLLFADRHPFAGGPGHRAAYLENGEGFEVELVAVEEGTEAVGGAGPGAGVPS